MIAAIVIAAILLVAFACIHYWVLKQWKRSQLREQRARQDREEVVAFLNHFADSIITTDDPHQWMKQVAGYVAATIGASTLCIYAFERGVLLKVATTGSPLAPSHEPLPNSRANRLLTELLLDTLDPVTSRIAEVHTSSQPLIENFTEGPAGPLQSVMIVPITSGDTNVGIICAVNKRAVGQHYDQDDLFLLMSLANQVAFGSYLIGVYEELTSQERMKRELELARAIQTSLLPAHPPPGRRLKTDAVNLPAREVSGDFYDFITLDDDTMLVVIADAAGKGFSACMLMAVCRTFLRTNAQHYRNDLEGLLKHLNQNLYDDTDDTQFVTMACCLVDKRDNTIEYARAGHTELLIRQADGRVDIIQPAGPALGLLPPDLDPEFDTFAFTWLPGTSILLYTDGISEALNSAHEEFGLDRLIEVWQAQSADPVEATKGILAAVHSFTGLHAQSDDQTMVILSRALDVDPAA